MVVEIISSNSVLNHEAFRILACSIKVFFPKMSETKLSGLLSKFCSVASSSPAFPLEKMKIGYNLKTVLKRVGKVLEPSQRLS